MASLHTIFQDIADIICDKPNGESLKLKIETDQFDWKKIVPLASSHLVIPLLYCKLKEKDLLDSLPKDLLSYLEEITNQNRERNKTILKEVKDISLLLNTHKIDHVFLKGAALLASGIYKDIGERMIGDIDILVHPNQLIDAQNLLLNHGYSEIETTFGSKFFEHKHLARLIPVTKLIAIEIHRKLLHRPIKNQLEPLKILRTKRLVNSIAIPNNKVLLNHTVLNFEINDYGYYYKYMGLRNSYDALILMDKLTTEVISVLVANKYIGSFFEKASCYFILKESVHIKRLFQFRKKIFLLKQKNKIIAKLTYVFLWNGQFINIMIKRFFFIH